MSTPSPSTARNFRIVFTPSGLQGEVIEGVTVLDAARQLGVDLDSVCGGRGICGRCQVGVSSGRFAKWAIESAEKHLTPAGSTELNYGGSRPLGVDLRLGCAAAVVGDLVIDVPRQSQMHRQVVSTDIDVGEWLIDPVHTPHYLEVSQPCDLLEVLSDQWGIDAELGEVDGLLNSSCTVVVQRSGDAHVVTKVLPGYVDALFGVAVDIGSTTIVAHCLDLGSGELVGSAGRMNPRSASVRTS